MPLTLVEGERTWKTDRSTPKATAESYVEMQLREEDAADRIWKEFMEKLAAHLKKYNHSSTWGKAEKQLAADVKRGRQRGVQWDPAVKEIQSKGTDVAHAIVELPGQVIMAGEKEQEIKDRREFKRLILKKVGPEWLVESVQDRCFGCTGSGKKASGKGNCPSCDGEGYRKTMSLF